MKFLKFLVDRLFRTMLGIFSSSMWLYCVISQVILYIGARITIFLWYGIFSSEYNYFNHELYICTSPNSLYQVRRSLDL